MNNHEFKRYLSTAGLTQAKTAELLHVTDRSVRSWVSGKYPIPSWAVQLLHFKLAYPREFEGQNATT
jgi:DNA-binding transcriptional regulator YiaG